MKAILFVSLMLFGPFMGHTQTIAEAGSGNCLVYDGASNYVNVGSDIYDTQTQGSVTAWIYITSNSQSGYSIMSSASQTSTVENWRFRVRNLGAGNLILNVRTRQPQNGVFGSTVLQLNRWYHVAVTSDGVDWKLYVNGVEETLTIDAGSNTGGWFNEADAGPNAYTIGAFERASGVTQFFPGQIDEVRVWDNELTPAEIRESMCQRLPDNFGNGLVGYWRFDEGSDANGIGNCGDHVCDASGSGNHGTKF